MRLPNIPPDVWGARRVFTELRVEAHARTAGADGVLWSFLVSVAAGIPARVAYHSGIGVPARSTLFAALAGSSGSGKSLGFNVARSLLPAGAPEPLPLSTGEGLIESFYGKVLRQQQQPDGKSRLVTVRERVRSNCMLFLDEGETLFRQIERPGNTVAPTLRTAWSGGTLGQANASEDNRRILVSGTYAAGLVVGLQPDISGRLLKDTTTGTAQRFLWVASTDRYLTDTGHSPSLVGIGRPLAWSTPRLPGERSDMAQFLNPYDPDAAPVLMKVTSEIAASIRTEQVALRRGDTEPDEHDTQRTTMHVKVAGVLAWIDGRLDITAEDWQLGGELLKASDLVRDALLDHAEVVVHRERTEKGIERAQISRAETEAEVLRERCRDRLVLLLADRDVTAHRELVSGVSTAQRAFIAEALAELIEKEAVVAEHSPSGGRRYRMVSGA